MNDFKFNENGRLIIDFAWRDLRYPASIFVMIDGEIYKTFSVYHENGKILSESLIPAENYNFNENANAVMRLGKSDYLYFFAAEKEN